MISSPDGWRARNEMTSLRSVEPADQVRRNPRAMISARCSRSGSNWLANWSGISIVRCMGGRVDQRSGLVKPDGAVVTRRPTSAVFLRWTLCSWLLLWFFLEVSSFAQGVANPVFTPPDGTRLPVTVTISNATAGSTVYYTTNGTVPVTNSAIYSVPLAFTNDTVLRARAFKSGQTPSDTISAAYIAWPDAPGVACQRTVTNDLPSTPLVTLKVSGASNVTCFTIEERLPAVVQATNISSSGYLTNRTVRWGPFTNTATVTVSYRATGLPGTYTVDGSVSVDGAWTFGPSPSSVTISTAGGGDVPSQLPQVAMPVFSPPSGSGVPTNVTITCAMEIGRAHV